MDPLLARDRRVRHDDGMADLDVRPLSPALGAEIVGVDAREPLDPDVDADHTRRAALQQHVGEAAGALADVQAGHAGHVDAAVRERAVELEAAARDETQLRVVGDLDLAARGQVVSNTGPLTAVDNILMLQGVDDTLSGRSKGLVHGEELLDMLDEVRDGLLSGGIPRRTLNRIANAVSKRQDGFADPKLQNVLDEIELRAKVELAKLEQADQHYA